MWFMICKLGYNLSFSNSQLYLSLKVKRSSSQNMVGL